MTLLQHQSTTTKVSVCIMAIELAGNRIIKSLKYGRTMITEKTGNITYTKVLNHDGTELVSRAKKIEKEQVGDKFIITRTDAKKVNDYKNDPEKCMSYGFKTILSRVFNKDGEYLGGKLTEYRPRQASILSGNNPLEYIKNSVRFETKCSAKSKDGYSNYGSFTKQFGIIDDGRVLHKKANMTYNPGELKTQYRSSIESPKCDERIELGQAPKEWSEFYNDLSKRTHNKKGLPFPTRLDKENTEILDYNKMNDMSLKEMRQLWYDKTHAATDYSRAMNLNSLNNVSDMTLPKVKDTSVPLNDFAQYL